MKKIALFTLIGALISGSAFADISILNQTYEQRNVVLKTNFSAVETTTGGTNVVPSSALKGQKVIIVSFTSALNPNSDNIYLMYDENTDTVSSSSYTGGFVCPERPNPDFCLQIQPDGRNLILGKYNGPEPF